MSSTQYYDLNIYFSLSISKFHFCISVQFPTDNFILYLILFLSLKLLCFIFIYAFIFNALSCVIHFKNKLYCMHCFHFIFAQTIQNLSSVFMLAIFQRIFKLFLSIIDAFSIFVFIQINITRWDWRIQSLDGIISYNNLKT